MTNIFVKSVIYLQDLTQSLVLNFYYLIYNLILNRWEYKIVLV